MQNREFEKTVQQQMEQLKLAPSDALWAKVEAALPAEKKPRRWLFFILPAAAVCTGLILLNKYTATTQQEHTAGSTAVISTPATGNKGNHTSINTAQQTGPVIPQVPAVNENSVLQNTTPRVTAPAAGKTIVVQKERNETADEATSSTTGVAQNKKTTKKGLAVKEKVKIKVKQPEPVNDSVEALDEIVTEPAFAGDANKTATYNTGEKTTVTSTPAIAFAVTLPAKDTAVKAAVVNEVKKQKKQPSKWQYGVYAALGKAGVKNGFLSSQLYNYSSNPAIFNQPGAGLSNSYGPAGHSAGAGFAVGFSAEKKLNERWKFLTALTYSYQSNSVLVGKKIDSAVMVSIDATRSITAPHYYTVGIDQKYRNSFHFAEIPLLLQYRPFKKSSFYTEGGITAGVLLQSNALVYTNAGVFVNDASFFNRVQLSVDAGAGFTFLHKTKYPLSIGYRFRHGLLPVSKSSVDKQYLINPLLYARLCFKK